MIVVTYLVRNSSKASMKNDMLDFNVIKFFGINTRTGKVLRHLSVRWKFPSSGWVKINTCGDILVLLLVEVFSVGSMKEFIGAFSAFLEVQSVMVAEFYGVIHDTEEAQKMRLTNL